jgi:hypothetical protein
VHGLAYVVGEHDFQPVLDLLARVEALGCSAQQRGSLCVARLIGAAGRIVEQILPSAQTSATSIPAGILISALWTQVSHGSLQPSTRNVHGPSRSSDTDAVHQSKPSGVVGRIDSTRSLPSGSVSTTDALTASCPSRKTVARIGMDSPTTALAGYAPPSITGETLVTGIRSINVPRTGCSITTAAATSVGAGSATAAVVALAGEALSRSGAGPELVAVTVVNLSARPSGVGVSPRSVRASSPPRPGASRVSQSDQWQNRHSGAGAGQLG